MRRPFTALGNFLRKPIVWIALALIVVGAFIYFNTRPKPIFATQPANPPSGQYGYQVPIQPDSPWALFRRDHRNTANSPLPAQYNAQNKPWSFQTEKGIFSTPVIDHAGTIYVGSADHNFYALDRDGTLKWKFATGEIIDSAAAIPQIGLTSDSQTILVPSGDGLIYNLKTDANVSDAERVVWKFDARSAPGTGFNNWFEGNVALGYDGTIYAGSTNFNYYALTPGGQMKWTYPTTSNNWSIAALGDDGTIFWGSNDTYIRAVDPNGQEKWRKMTLGFIAASAAVGSDGTVYMGSFDSYFSALDPQTGAEKWKFKTNDHIYASAALGHDAQGNTNAIYVASADGTLYALTTHGTLLWKYDTGDVIRSSPVIGKTPDSSADIIYFGAGNGKLYALNADGTRRWSYNTTSGDAELRDRNDLNGSPALGNDGIYIGGETGHFWFVPYEYCVQQTDARCEKNPGSDLPADYVGVMYVTPGGNTLAEKNITLPAATLIPVRLVVRKNGETVNAFVCNAPIGCGSDEYTISIDPPVPFSLQHSADGKYLYVRPQSFLEPGKTYTLNVRGNYYTGGNALGNLTLGGSKAGTFNDTLNLNVEQNEIAQLPLRVDPNRTSAFEWTRLAAPLPTMLPSLNQIGFDYMDWMVGTIATTEPDASRRGKVLLWAIGAKRNANGVLVADPQTKFVLPLSGEYQGDAFIVSDQKFVMPITEIPIPFDLFELRGRMDETARVKPGASAYAETDTLSIPNFGPYLVVAGLANNWIQKMTVLGTYITRPFDEHSTANGKPNGVSVSSLDYVAPTSSQPGKVTTNIRVEPGAKFSPQEHHASILLVDAATLTPVYLDYQKNLVTTADANGNLATITLTLPAKTSIPDTLQAFVILDVFPIHQQALKGETK